MSQFSPVDNNLYTQQHHFISGDDSGADFSTPSQPHPDFSRSPKTISFASNRRSQQSRAQNNNSNNNPSFNMSVQDQKSLKEDSVHEREELRKGSLVLSVNNSLMNGNNNINNTSNNESKSKFTFQPRQVKSPMSQQNSNINQSNNFESESIDDSSFNRMSFLKNSSQSPINRLRLFDDKLSFDKISEVSSAKIQFKPAAATGATAASPLNKMTSMMSQASEKQNFSCNNFVRFAEESQNSIHLFEPSYNVLTFLQEQRNIALKAISKGVSKKSSLLQRNKSQQKQQQQQGQQGIVSTTPKLSFVRLGSRRSTSQFNQVVNTINNNNTMRKSSFQLDHSTEEQHKTSGEINTDHSNNFNDNQIQKSKFLEEHKKSAKKARRVSASKIFGNLTEEYNDYEKHNYIKKLSSLPHYSIERVNSLKKSSSPPQFGAMLRFVQKHFVQIISNLIGLSFFRESSQQLAYTLFAGESLILFTNIFANTFTLTFIQSFITSTSEQYASITQTQNYSMSAFFVVAMIVLLLLLETTKQVQRNSDCINEKPALNILFNSNRLFAQKIPKLSIALLQKRFAVFERAQDGALSDSRFNIMFNLWQIVLTGGSGYLAYLIMKLVFENQQDPRILLDFSVGVLLSLLILAHAHVSEMLYDYLDKVQLESSEATLLRWLAVNSVMIFAQFQLKQMSVFSNDFDFNRYSSTSADKTQNLVECVVSQEIWFAFGFAAVKLLFTLLTWLWETLYVSKRINKQLRIANSLEEEEDYQRMRILSTTNEDMIHRETKKERKRKVHPMNFTTGNEVSSNSDSDSEIQQMQQSQSRDYGNTTLLLNNQHRLHLNSVESMVSLVVLLFVNSSFLALVFISQHVFLIGIVINLVILLPLNYLQFYNNDSRKLTHSFLSQTRCTGITSQLSYAIVAIAVAVNLLIILSDSSNSQMVYSQSIVEQSADFLFDNDTIDQILSAIFNPTLLIGVILYLSALVNSKSQETQLKRNMS